MMPLKTAREARNISQRKLATAVKIHQTVISRAEKNCEPFSPENAEKLARFFGYPWTEMHFLYPERYKDIEGLA